MPPCVASTCARSGITWTRSLKGDAGPPVSTVRVQAPEQKGTSRRNPLAWELCGYYASIANSQKLLHKLFLNPISNRNEGDAVFFHRLAQHAKVLCKNVARHVGVP